MNSLIQLLKQHDCSLVVRDKFGSVTTYHQKGVRDLIALLDNAAHPLDKASVADKVVGRAAAALMARGGVKCVWAEVMSRQAVPFLQAAGITYGCAHQVERIVQCQGDDCCPLEEITQSAQTAEEAERLLRTHFEQRRLQRNKTAKPQHTNL